VGHEVDIVRRHGGSLDAWECKSGGTYVAEWAKGLDYWRGHAGAGQTRRGIIYGGDTSFVRSGIRVLAWREAGKAAI